MRESVVPPASLPPYMVVVVSSTVTKPGSTISGDVDAIVVVATDGWNGGPNRGRAGTDTVVAVLCTNS